MLKQFSRFFWSYRQRWAYGLLATIVAISLCVGTPKPSYSFSWLDLLFRGIQVLQISNLSDAQEVRLGRQINQQLVRGGKINLSRNTQLNQYLNEIGQRLAQNSDRPNIPYTFQVVNDRTINAFATMGGFVYINTGLMLEADNEAELASVMAHEIGHITARHAIKQMRDSAISQGLLSAAGLNENTAVQIGVKLALSLPNSREDELEADQLGLITLEQTGYAPSAMVSFMKKLLKKRGSVPAFLSTHPATSERIIALNQKINPETADLGEGLDNRAYKNRIGLR